MFYSAPELPSVVTPLIENIVRGTTFFYPSEDASIVEKLQSLYPAANLTEKIYQNACETNNGQPYYRKCTL